MGVRGGFSAAGCDHQSWCERGSGLVLLFSGWGQCGSEAPHLAIAPSASSHQGPRCRDFTPADVRGRPRVSADNWPREKSRGGVSIHTSGARVRFSGVVWTRCVSRDCPYEQRKPGGIERNLDEPPMDPDVSVCPLPVFLVSLCQGQSVGLVPGVERGSAGLGFSQEQPSPRRPPRPCCRGGCGGRLLFLVPALLLLLLGLGACLLLLRRALTQGASRSRDPDLSDLLRGDHEEEGLRVHDAPQTLAAPASTAASSSRWFPESLPTLTPGTAFSDPTSSPASTLALALATSSAPPPLGKCPKPCLFTHASCCAIACNSAL